MDNNKNSNKTEPFQCCGSGNMFVQSEKIVEQYQHHDINHRTWQFADDDIKKITQTYHNWCASTNSVQASKYKNVKGFCKSVSVEKMAAPDCVITSSRYVSLPRGEDDFDFNEWFSKQKVEFEARLKEEAKFNKSTLENLAKMDPINEH